MTETARNTYDEILYPGYPFRQTHPDRLATLAKVFGMQPQPIESCRVLELGCGEGANLIPMAFGLPESEFIGIDLAARPITKAQAVVRALGLKNINLHQLNVMEIGPGFGKFDYIIAHGLYSWVPPEVRDKILTVCKENLAANGVAYVSYNSYPGGHLRNMLREMMLFHTRSLAEPEQRINQARVLVKFLAESKTEPDAYTVFLKEELNHMLRRDDQVIYHDQLAEINSPFYFYQFIEQATKHGLQYLAEADFSEMQDFILPPPVSETLRRLAGNQIVIKEQYMDFVKCRAFRQTLMCHRDIALNRKLGPEQMMNFYVASSAGPASPEPGVGPSSLQEFRGQGATLWTKHPLAKAALLHLKKVWPRSLHFNELLARVRDTLNFNSKLEDAGISEDALALGDVLLAAYAVNSVELHVQAPSFVMEVSERPVASPLARLQAQDETIVTNLCHIPVQMEDRLVRHLLLLMDGTRDRSALLNELAALVRAGVATVQQDGQPINDEQRAFKILEDGLEENLARVAQLALLVG